MILGECKPALIPKFPAPPNLGLISINLISSLLQKHCIVLCPIKFNFVPNILHKSFIFELLCILLTHDSPLIILILSLGIQFI